MMRSQVPKQALYIVSELSQGHNPDTTKDLAMLHDITEEELARCFAYVLGVMANAKHGLIL